MVIPAFTDRITYPRFALTEAFRILKDGGLLAIAYAFSDVTSCPSLQKFNKSLENLGLVMEESLANSGRIMLRKISRARFGAQSRAA